MSRTLHWACLCAALVIAPVAPGAPAQPAQPGQGPPNALQGFSQNRDQPVRIQSDRLEVRDKDKVATFFGETGPVHLVQGDTTMKCRTLVVFYEQSGSASPGAMTAAQPGPAGSSSIRRVEAKGSVVVTQKDQVATGDSGIFDMKTNTVRLEGNVVLTQGQNVIKGDRLLVDMTNGSSKVECAKGSPRCRVDVLINPSSMNKPSDGAGGKDAPKPGLMSPLRPN